MVSPSLDLSLVRVREKSLALILYSVNKSNLGKDKLFKSINESNSKRDWKKLNQKLYENDVKESDSEKKTMKFVFETQKTHSL